MESSWTGSRIHFGGTTGDVVVVSGAVDTSTVLDVSKQLVAFGGIAYHTSVLNGSLEELDSGGVSVGAVLTLFDGSATETSPKPSIAENGNSRALPHGVARTFRVEHASVSTLRCSASFDVAASNAA